MPRPFIRPYAITMWDFSWLERRWPGAGYEDWDLALDELVERGYDAVRIDAYPHLVSADPQRVWELLPGWNQTSWGAQSIVHVQVLPALLDFIRACKRRDIGVALSTWYRQDRNNTRMNIRTPEDQARIWIDTLRHIDEADLLDSILFVDFCNEFPQQAWSAYLYDTADPMPTLTRTSSALKHWMNESIRVARAEFPQLDYTYSFAGEYANWAAQDTSEFDLLEPHVWMSAPVTGEYQAEIGYFFERFDPVGFDNIVAHGRRVYEERPEYWDAQLFRAIDLVADWSRATSLGLVTTECWSLVDYKDWPGLEWDWIMDLTEKGLRHAASTGRWIGMATSNFCGPQFVGMWREIDWHRRLTDVIKESPIAQDISDRHDTIHVDARH
jgi:hypothetical protein